MIMYHIFTTVVRVLVLRQVPKRPFLRQFRQCLKIDEKEAEEGGRRRDEESEGNIDNPGDW